MTSKTHSRKPHTDRTYCGRAVSASAPRHAFKPATCVVCRKLADPLKTVTVPADLYLDVLEQLRLGPTYIDMPEDGEDGFKRHKWEPHRREAAEEMHAAYRKLLRQGADQWGVEISE